MSQSLATYTLPRSPILALPLEISQQTLIHSTPSDVSSIAQTCRTFREIIYSSKDTHLWKNLFLDMFDDPRVRIYVDKKGLKGVIRLGQNEWCKEIGEVEYDWMNQLQRRIGAWNLVRSKTRSISATCTQRKEVLHTFISIIQTSLPYIPGKYYLDEGSKNVKWLRGLLESTQALNHTVWPSLRNSLFTKMDQYPDEEEMNLRSRLHTYIGLTDGDIYPNVSSPKASGSTDDSISEVSSDTFINHSNFGSNLGLSFGATTRSRSASARLASTIVSETTHSILGPGGNSSTRPQRYGPPRSLRTAARAIVYDLRNYNSFHNWGPFVPDLDDAELDKKISTWKRTRVTQPIKQFSTNWRHLEALMVVVAWNVIAADGVIFDDEGLVLPMGLDALRPYGAPGVWGDVEKLGDEGRSKYALDDWAGVEGKWKRVVCFCDYNDLMKYNYSRAAYDDDTQLDASIFEKDNFNEATRALTANLRITSIDSSSSSSHPRINFEGVTDGGSPNESHIRGFVERTKNGEIHWSWVSIFDGAERWSSVGVQVGDVGCEAGIIGVWSGVHHMDGDPAGPFWMWKIEA